MKREQDERMVLLVHYASLPEAQIVQGELESCGLRTFLQQDQWLGVGRRSDQLRFGGRLFVLQKDLDRAREILGDSSAETETAQEQPILPAQDGHRLNHPFLLALLVLMVLLFLMLTLVAETR